MSDTLDRAALETAHAAAMYEAGAHIHEDAIAAGIAAYLSASPQPANPAQVTDALAVLEAHFERPLKEWEITAFRAALLAAIGAGGQAVKIGPLAHVVAEMLERAAETRPNGDILHDILAQAIPASLSQPHPADERVVEALEQHIQNNPDDLEAHIDLRAARLLYEKEGGRNEW